MSAISTRKILVDVLGVVEFRDEGIGGHETSQHWVVDAPVEEWVSYKQSI